MPRTQKTYHCNCRKHGYIPTEVSKATFYRHQHLRDEPMAMRNRLSRQGEVESNGSGAHDERNTPDPDKDPATGFSSQGEDSPDIDQESITPRPSSVRDVRSPLPSPEPEDDNPFRNMNFDDGEQIEDGSASQHRPPSPPRPVDPDEEELLATIYDNVSINDLKASLTFVEALSRASLDGPYSDLNADALYRLRNPPTFTLDLASDENLKSAVRMYLDLQHAQVDYNAMRDILIERLKTDSFPTYYQAKQAVEQLSGVSGITHDMCINTCVAYTGPYSDLNACPNCHESRFEDVVQPNGRYKRFSRQQFVTIPIGPQLQAMFRDPEGARQMRYRGHYTQSLFDHMNASDGLIDQFSDFFDGSDYLEAVRSGKITEHDIVLMFSVDGAQLYQSKESDCWMAIWVILDRSPETRYKKKYVLPACVIPGPKKPKNLDSFLFPGFHHLAAIQKEGLAIWDAARNLKFKSSPFLALATADGPGLAYLNGFVGHHGKNGCRLYCGLKGRHKRGFGIYYPVLLKPDGYRMDGCDHDDVDPKAIQPTSPDLYFRNLAHLMQSRTDAQYKHRRLETGISKPSIFLGFPRYRILGIPTCFASDIMHLCSLNIPDLQINLWRGAIDCDPQDSKDTWWWATLVGETWKQLGKDVADTRSHLPGSYDRPPRNIAEKINSGYKAWEFWLFLYGLGPALLYDRLPHAIWQHFCKLVQAVRIVCQHTITRDELKHANRLFREWGIEFEELYCERKISRIHFVRQSVHAPQHYAREVATKGPLICSSQWTMERTIGNLTEEIRQPSNPYANLGQRAIRRAQVNALKAMIPSLDKDTELHIPLAAKDMGQGYVLLPSRDRTARPTSIHEGLAIRKYIEQHYQNSPLFNCFAPDGTIRVLRWARIRLPNGQIARSRWKEEFRESARKARNVQIDLNGQPRFAEVRYFLECRFDSENLLSTEGIAIASLYSHPHPDLLAASNQTYISCLPLGDEAVLAIPIKSIKAVIAMIPERRFDEDRMFFVPRPGGGIPYLGEFQEESDAEDNTENS